MGMTAILFNAANYLNHLSMPFRQKASCEIWWELPPVKSGENCSSGFREEDIYIQNFTHVYSLRARADNPRGQNFDRN